MSNKRRTRAPQPRQDLLNGGLTADEAVQMREMLAASGAPAYVLDAIRPGVDLLNLLAEAERNAPMLEIPELIAELGDALEDAFRGKGDPFFAEATILELLGALRSAYPGESVADDSPALVAKITELIEHAERAATPEALVLLRVVGLHGPDESRLAAAGAADRLVAGGVTEPAWCTQIGRPTVVESFGYGDIVGSQESVSVTFAHGRKRHVVSVLIDYDLGGGVKDCWLSSEATKVKAQCRSLGRNPFSRYSDHSVGEGLRILRAALAAEPCPEQPDQLQDTATFLPLLRQRVALLDKVG